MQQLTANVFAETGLHGANHGFVTTSDGIVLIDTPHKPSDALRLKAEIERRGPLRYTSNNIFCKVQTWLQEANPEHWLKALESLRALREETFVPGHGPVSDKRYLDEQGAFIQEWADYVRRGIEHGMTKDECLANLTAM